MPRLDPDKLRVVIAPIAPPTTLLMPALSEAETTAVSLGIAFAVHFSCCLAIGTTAGFLYAATVKNKPVARERALQIAELKMPEYEVGEYVRCVVYHYPKAASTMTTTISMTKADFDRLHDLLK